MFKKPKSDSRVMQGMRSLRHPGKILRGLNEVLAFLNGIWGPNQYVVHILPEVNVKAARSRLRMTQQEFATKFGFSVNTARHWE